MLKPYTRPKHSSTIDWHPADVVAALAKAGHRLDKVGPALGLHRSAGSKALGKCRWPRVKSHIASLLALPPQDIWPSIFDETGAPKPLKRTARSHKKPRPRNVCHTDKRRAA
jgi:Ner family transcriptional regulator